MTSNSTRKNAPPEIKFKVKNRREAIRFGETPLGFKMSEM